MEEALQENKFKKLHNKNFFLQPSNYVFCNYTLLSPTYMCILCI